MSIINDNISVDFTTDQKVKQSHQRISRLSKQIRIQLERQHNEIWEIIWNNHQELTPQEVLDDFGTNAKDLFVFSQSIQTLLAEADPEGYEVKATPNEYTVNEDGTVTIGQERV